MAVIERLKGVVAPVLTPFTSDLLPDSARFIDHCRWLLAQGASLAPFGTTSEANSLALTERMELLDGIVVAGCDPARMMPGTGTTSLIDTVTLTRHATTHGCAGVLMLPPFYYKGVSEDGLFRYYSEVVQRVGDSRLRIYLYHIPPVAVVGITTGLVERLRREYPEAIVGMKDSSGDWGNTRRFLDGFAASGFDVFVGSESFLLENMRAGGVGCISATVNINPGPMVRLFESWRQEGADAAQVALDTVREVVGRYPMVPALKQVVAMSRRDSAWRTVRPPLVELTPEQARALTGELESAAFSMKP